MGSRERRLLDQIERDALDSSTGLADALRKCVALAGRSTIAIARCFVRRVDFRSASAPENLTAALRTYGSPFYR